jgi:predicted RNA-binding Zn-ribbon protein involved in translation (DUF1610 family)
MWVLSSRSDKGKLKMKNLQEMLIIDYVKILLRKDSQLSYQGDDNLKLNISVPIVFTCSCGKSVSLKFNELSSNKAIACPSCILSGKFVINWAKEVKIRDNYTCKKCGKPGNIAHHIIPRRVRPDLAHQLDNGITLCTDCHAHEHVILRLKEELI